MPEFTSYEEEAQWWDRHDPLDHIDPSVPITVVRPDKKTRIKSVFLNGADKLLDSLNVRFDPQSLFDIRDIAHIKGIGPTTLVRMWTLEKLREEKITQKQSAAQPH